MNKFIITFLLISTLSFGQDLISVEVNVDKFVELINNKDKAILKLQNEVKYYKGQKISHDACKADKVSLNDSLTYYRSLWTRTEKLLAPRIIKKIKNDL